MFSFRFSFERYEGPFAMLNRGDICKDTDLMTKISQKILVVWLRRKYNKLICLTFLTHSDCYPNNKQNTQ